MAYFCKGEQEGCEANSMREPFENGMCDACWEKANVEDQSEWEFCRICSERATDDSPWCEKHSVAEDPLYISIEWSEMNEGYMYEIYGSEKAMTDGEDSLCGGLCTGTRLDAFEMALDTFRSEIKA